MRFAVIVACGAMVLSIGCGGTSEEPPQVEVFSGEVEVMDLLETHPDSTVRVDTVVFTVEGADYRLDHLTHNSNLCSSGGTIGNFGSNRVTLTPVFHVPGGNCDSTRIPKGEFKAVFKGDSLILGPDSVGYIIEVDHQQFRDSLCFTFWLSK